MIPASRPTTVYQESTLVIGCLHTGRREHGRDKPPDGAGRTLPSPDDLLDRPAIPEGRPASRQHRDRGAWA